MQEPVGIKQNQSYCINQHYSMIIWVDNIVLTVSQFGFTKTIYSDLLDLLDETYLDKQAANVMLLVSVNTDLLSFSRAPSLSFKTTTESSVSVFHSCRLIVPSLCLFFFFFLATAS